ncbi:STAS domain-containing protein [Streptomyces sp. NBC_01304]|uniref:STAS domain-containing protein n=1 Tax=Streptomyces sp. NBC_01304 TaxID=2903818 RepID=UPI002E0E8896|nr:STAS domain-containing protein [Streptomyces sp. NBC_01304]
MLSSDTQTVTEYLRTYRHLGHTVLELHGEIDIAAVLEIRPHLAAATAAPRPLIVIDLTPAVFFDCAGVGLLCCARQRIHDRGGTLVLVCPHQFTLRILRAVRLYRVFHPVPTLGEALAEPPACG